MGCRISEVVPIVSSWAHSRLSSSPKINTAARLSSGSLLFPHFGLSAEEQQTSRHNFLLSAHLRALPVHKHYFSLHVCLLSWRLPARG
jgi:hypothetical protein